MNMRKLTIPTIALVVVALVLSACAGKTPAPTQAPPPQEAPTQAPSSPVPPTEPPPTAAPPTEVMATETEAAPAASAAFGEAWQSVDCDSIDVAPTVAAVSDCGYVTVPSNYSNGSGKTIQLAVARVKSPSASPGAPVFVGTGGPGGYGFSRIQKALDATNWPETHAALLAHHDWVYFTQRGSPGSIPEAGCQNADAIGYLTALEGWDEDQSIEEFTKAVQECYDTLTAEGIDLADYNSVENAEDVNSIREALGYDKIIFYGQSYGTQLAQFVMRQHPEMLESVIIDGVVPVEFTTYAQTQNMVDGFQRVFDACQADAECNADYPDLKDTLEQVYERLQSSPETVEVQSGGETQDLKVDGLAVVSGLTTQIYVGGADLPHLIHDLQDDSPAALQLLAPSDDSLNRHARMMNYAVNCSDDPSTSFDEFDLSGAIQALADYVHDDAVKYVLVPCPLIHVPQLPDSSDAPAVSDLPVLVFSGALDPVTPPSHGALVASHLPNSQHVVFPDGGHIQIEKPCAQAIFAAFLDDPMAPVDTSCVAERQTFSAPIEATVSSEDGSASLTMTLPAGFKLTNPNQWQSGQTVMVAFVSPAGTTAAEAIESNITKIGGSFDASQVTDGPAISGMPSKLLRGEITLGGHEYDYDANSIETANGTFVILSLQPEKSLLDWWRNTALPSILESVTVE